MCVRVRACVRVCMCVCVLDVTRKMLNEVLWRAYVGFIMHLTLNIYFVDLAVCVCRFHYALNIEYIFC